MGFSTERRLSKPSKHAVWTFSTKIERLRATQWLTDLHGSPYKAPIDAAHRYGGFGAALKAHIDECRCNVQVSWAGIFSGPRV